MFHGSLIAQARPMQRKTPMIQFLSAGAILMASACVSLGVPIQGGTHFHVRADSPFLGVDTQVRENQDDDGWTTIPTNLSSSAAVTSFDGLYTVTGSSVATWSPDGLSGTVALDFGRTFNGTGAKPLAFLDTQPMVNNLNWFYRFTADANGFFNYEGSNTATGDAVGFFSVYLMRDGFLIEVIEENTTEDGSVPLVAGTEYLFRLGNGGQYFDDTADDGSIAGRLTWSISANVITPTPTPTPTNGNPVPDGGTSAFLLGASLLAVGIASKRRSRT